MSFGYNSFITIPYLSQLFKQLSKSRWIQLCFALAIVSAVSTIPIMIKVLLNTNLINHNNGFATNSTSPESAFSSILELKGNKIVYENSLFIAFEFWRLWCLTDGIVHLNSLTIIASAWLSLFSVTFNILLVFESVNWITVQDPLKLQNMHFQIALTVIFAVLTIPVIVSAYKSSRVIGWQVYKKIGSSIELQGMYNIVQWFALMLKIDTFFEVVLMGCSAIAASSVALKAAGSSMALLLIFALILGRVAITKESHWMMCLFLGTQICLLAINVFILTELLNTSQEMQWYAGIAYVVTSCVCIIITMFLSIRCLMNFRKGLMPYVYWMPFGKKEDSMYNLSRSSVGPGLIGQTKTYNDFPIDDDDDEEDMYRSSSDTGHHTPSLLEKNEPSMQSIYNNNNKFGYSNASRTSLDRPEITRPTQNQPNNKLDTIKVVNQRIVPVASTLPSLSTHNLPTRLTLKPMFKPTSPHTVVSPSASSPTYSSRPMNRESSYESIPLFTGN